ncbi:DNA polymerase III subunit beta [Candidatus Palibaumannia cicadellinicola]|uniref:Beta sliding clamp n=1 Tax=Baumannia cicadellinicola subsp. Homalodisca coagulata TaxID=374463 RepID=Q1LTW3_BAUCH|nr:DNA polymerase III subunit beta [Candidatus Baumannia cicadellinicola]ABF13991.1 DNA polymerase III, beta subunit [Baumannia cicadellinicola str. Hc (Homalodisca coagulata)]MBS0032656.1 DNA polymerase III subunit beta [Candidatus Baumannia cicadellinicola]MCJ7462418.1 DNA polymerase III subunit beta [Candidatus Baumannia cicadellinicola]MCJ7463050.1 DNA polymerase III subunit beta [Candidatus Baumannia cicadellinicola]
MKFTIERKYLLKPLQQVSSRLSGRHQLPILTHLLLQVTENYLILTGTNLEIEIVAKITINKVDKIGIIMVCARKLFDICRSLPEDALINITLEGTVMLVIAGRSRFSLMTLPATNFPKIADGENQIVFNLPLDTLKKVIQSTQFSMAHQDVRYSLNGLLFEITGKELRTVATDGHRLAACTIYINVLKQLPYCSIIVPRKGVIELLRILDLDYGDNMVKLQICSNNIRIYISNYIFTSNLIEGNFPDYHSVLPKNVNKILKVRRDLIKQALTRVAILSNDKFRCVRLYLRKNQLKITAKNLEQEEAEEILDVSYEGPEIEVSFNVNYILDILGILKCDTVRLLFNNEASSVQIDDCMNPMSIYIVMPMRM